MNVQVKIRNAAVWGIGCIVAELLVLTQRGVAHSALDPYFRLFWFEFAIMLAIFTFSAHMWGYRYVGKKLQNMRFASAAQYISILTFLFGIVLMIGVALSSFQAEPKGLINVVLGFFILLLMIVDIAFVWLMIKMRQQLPLWSYLTLGILGFPFLIWRSWLMIILLIPSTLFLFQQSKSSS